jgi:hypothetical protein
MDGTATLGTGTLSSGQATFSTSTLSVAAHTITATYNGDTSFARSTSGALTQTVKVLDPPLTITHTAAGVNEHGQAGAAVTFTDADPNGNLSQYRATINWGDTSTTPASIGKDPFFGGFAAGGFHTYAAGGRYTVTITVYDVEGATQAASVQISAPTISPD